MIMKLKYIHYHQSDMEDKVHVLYSPNIQWNLCKQLGHGNIKLSNAKNSLHMRRLKP